jgi:hypothetical protein
MRGIAIVAGLLVTCAVAAAQPAQPKGKSPSRPEEKALPRPEDKAEADRLFEQGRELLAKGERAEACKLFDDSFRKDPRAVGTMLNLGLCREEVGQVASAVRFYAEARDRAHDQNLPEHQEAAERKIAMLSPRVPHIAIALPPNTSGARVLLDDTVLAADQLTDVTVDPGTHSIVVTAPDKLPYDTKLDVKEGEHAKIVVPPLEGAKTIVVHTDRRRLWGKLAVGSGATLIIGAIGLGAYSRHLYWKQFPDGARDGELVRDDAHDCWTVLVNGSPTRQCNDVGSNALDNARLVGHFATGAAILGGAGVIAGAILWATAPKKDESIALGLSPRGITATVRF